MIPAAIEKAIEGTEWSAVIILPRPRATWITLLGPQGAIDIRYTKWRHTTARAHRGNALTAVLDGQQAIVDYLTSTT